MKIPSLILKQMYTLGSLENVEDGVRFSLKNRLSNATVTRVAKLRIDGKAVPARAADAGHQRRRALPPRR